MTQRRGSLCVLRLRLGLVPDITVFAPPHLPPRVIRPQCPWCCLPCAYASPAPSFFSYDVVFMSINEPYRLVLSDVRARLQRTK